METTVATPVESSLVKIVETSGLEKPKADYILEKFQDYFKIAADWEQKSKMLVVSSSNQTAEMKMAREGRLFLRQKRIDIEKARKELKEQSLREGKAIDGIANVLKALIEPIEEYLDKQERFVEIQEDNSKEARKVARTSEMQSIGLDPNLYDLKNMPEESYKQVIDAQHRANEERQKAEAERITKEKAEAEERERVRLENERLKEEAQEKEWLLAQERAKVEQERKAAEEKQRKDKAEAEAREKKLRAEAERKQKAVEEQAKKERVESEARERKLRAEQEAKLRQERLEREKIAAELKAKEEKERAEKRRIEDEEKKAARRPDKEKLLALADSIQATILPEVKSPEAKNIVKGVRTLLAKTSTYIRIAYE